MWGLPYCLSSSCCQYVTSGHQGACPSRAPGRGRGVVCSDKGPMAGHRGRIIGAITTSGGPGKQGHCLPLPETPDGDGQRWAWGGAGRCWGGQWPLHLFAVGLQEGIPWEAWPRVGPICSRPQPPPRAGLWGQGGGARASGWAGLGWTRKTRVSVTSEVPGPLWTLGFTFV